VLQRALAVVVRVDGIASDIVRSVCGAVPPFLVWACEDTVTMHSPTDEDLIQALGNGDETALRILVERHTPAVYKFSIRYTGDESLAQDICQEVFLKVYRHARRYRPGMIFKTWLFTIVRNTSIDMARPYTYRKMHSLDTSDETDLFQAASRPLFREPQNPEEDYASKQTAHRLASALRTLSEKQRTATILKYFEEMPIKEIAEVMETTVSSVESLLVRAKCNLAKLLR
jgi:RNA polymerase sigma-70 factor, ECF subfamily